MLSEAYNKHLRSLIDTLRSDDESSESSDPVSLTAYDFHAQVRVGGHDLVKEDFQRRLSDIRQAREKFGWTVVDRTGGQIVERQQGVFRTNVSITKCFRACMSTEHFPPCTVFRLVRDLVRLA